MYLWGKEQSERGEAIEKAVRTWGGCLRASEIEFVHSHILTRRDIFVYLFAGPPLKVSELPENLIGSGS